MRRREEIADAPARNRIGLGQGAARYGPFVHARQIGKIRIFRRLVHDVLVYFVDDGKGVVFLHQAGDDFQLCLRKHLAAGIGRVAEDDRLRTLPEGVFQHVGVKGEVRLAERHVNGLAAGQQHVRAVGFVKRRKYDDLISRVDEGHHRRHQGFRAAAGDDDFLFRVQRLAGEGPAVVRQGLPQVLCAAVYTVLVRPLRGYILQAVPQGFRRGKIGKAFR